MSDNPSAFPSGDKAAHPTSTFDPGMTLRDWFAGQALESVMQFAIAAAHQGNLEQDMGEGDMARAAYAIADAMLAERKKGGAA